MRKYKLLGMLMLLGIIGLFSYGFLKNVGGGDGKAAKTSTNDDSDYIAINQIFMWVANNGMGSHDPVDDDSGFFWPGGAQANKSAVFSDGLIWGGKVGREIRVGGATYRYGLQAGPIIDGVPVNPTDEEYRIYRVRKELSGIVDPALKQQMEKDYAEWPGDMGAPYFDLNDNGQWDGVGIDQPKLEGDEVLWCVMNDMDAGRTTFLYGTNPMGLEVQMTVFGFNRTGDLGNMVFKKYTVINKGTRNINDMVFGYWSDTDLGTADDDFTGCDTVLSLGYTYNGESSDGVYGIPPAMGYDFFQGPIVPSTNPADSAKFRGRWVKGMRNLPMTAFTFYINGSTVYDDPQLGVPTGAIEMYNYLTGYLWNGEPFIDPKEDEEVDFCLAGDPVAGTGWYEGESGWPSGEAPGDRRHLMASGPFTMTPGDTQEIVVGLVIARGTDRLSSVTELKRRDQAAQIAYDLDFDITPPPPAPVVHHFSEDEEVTIWWEDNAEGYDEGDPLIYSRGFPDTTYTFEGYRLWQFPSPTSGLDEAVLIKTWDIQNDVNQIIEITARGSTLDTTVIEVLPNDGIKNYFKVEQDYLNKIALTNGTPYYFAVTSFGYSQYSIPQLLESSPAIFEVFPRRSNIDETYSLIPGEDNTANMVEGVTDTRVTYTVVDPTQLIDADYRVEINTDDDDELYWNLYRDYQGVTDTMLVEQYSFGAEDDTLSFNTMVDGFYVNVYNVGQDSIGGNTGKLKRVVEVQNGEVVGNVFMNESPNGGWMITTQEDVFVNNPDVTAPKTLDALNGYDNMTNEDYEIRFTGNSGYYLIHSLLLGNITAKTDSLAPDTVPFEIWSIGQTPDDASDDVRHLIKVKDASLSGETFTTRDNDYTQKDNGQWEPFFSFIEDDYPDQLPITQSSWRRNNLRLTNIVFDGDLPSQGTVIRFVTWKPTQGGEEFTFSIDPSNLQDIEAAKTRLEEITVYPNPYFASHGLEQTKYQRFVRFLGLPQECIVRIYSIAGVFIDRIDKNSTSDYVDWDLLNDDNLPVSSGVYLIHIDMPGIGEKVMKLSVIREAQYIDSI